jgi:hypothetical protein
MYTVSITGIITTHLSLRLVVRSGFIDIYPDRNISASPLNIVCFRRQFPDA